MNIDKKVDANYRVSIPKEFTDKLNWSIGDEIKVFVEDNKIILARKENALEVNLVPQEKKPRLNNILSVVKDKIPALEESTPIKINKNPVEDRCHQCLGKLNGSKFLLNGRYICRKCRNTLRDELVFEITHRD